MLKKIIFSIIAFVIAFLILEFAARVCVGYLEKSKTNPESSGWQNHFFETFLGWHENDPDLLWRFKKNLSNPLVKTNSNHLLGNEISPKKEVNCKRILLLGDSSPVGLGLKSRNEAFGEIVKNLLELEYLGIYKIELINAAVSGYSSEQIARFLKNEGWTYDPDIVILYCGNNDASISGSLSDQQLMKSQKLKSTRKILSNLAIYRIIGNLIAGDINSSSKDPNNLVVRVSPERFEKNLADIAKQCKVNDCPLIICQPPVPMLWPAGLQFRLFRYMKDKNDQLIFPEQMIRLLGRPIKYCLDSSQFKQIYSDFDIFTKNVLISVYNDTMPPDKAIQYYSELIDSDNKNFIYVNNLGVSYWQIGDYEKAHIHLNEARELYINSYDQIDISRATSGSPFLYNIGINLISMSDNKLNPLLDGSSLPYIYLDSALQADFFSLRIKKPYYEKINEFREYENVSIIDLPGIFKKNGGESLFVDHCHPKQEGHILIANTIFNKIKNQKFLD